MTPELRALETLFVESQNPLVAFLKTVIELSFAMLGTARLTSGRSQVALEAVRQELRVICSLEGRVEDPESRSAIHNKAIELELALDVFSILTG
jgi:hypothetical protein